MTERTSDLSTALVVDAAVDLLAENDHQTITLTRIASELGVSQPALYRHVNGVDDLWRELGLRGRAELANAVSEAAIGRSGETAVTSMAAAWRQFSKDHRGLYAATDIYPCSGDDELEAAVERVVAVLAMGLRGFDLDETATVDAARALRSSLHGFVHLEMGEGHPHSQDLDASFDRMIRLLSAGFARLEPIEGT